MLSRPHGGRLIDCIVSPDRAAEILGKSKEYKKLTISDSTAVDADNIGRGIFSPLTGFMNQEDMESVVFKRHLANNLLWTIPIYLDAKKEEANKFDEGDDILLELKTGKPIALLHLKEKFSMDKMEIASHVLKTIDESHPGVAKLMHDTGDIFLGGNIEVLNTRPTGPYEKYDLSPKETRILFKEKGWRTVVAFQTRNPVHRAHEYIQKCALEIVDGLLLHPLVGETKSDDIPANVRIECYEVLLKNYYPANRTVFSIFPVNMRYAGPREAIFHALVRKNYGCTHFIVGRDHAGVGNFYGTYDAQRIFFEFEPDEIGITPLFFEHSFYCKKCGNMASPKTCPHSNEDHIILSGTKVREMLKNGQVPPPEFTRPEVAEILLRSN